MRYNPRKATLGKEYRWTHGWMGHNRRLWTYPRMTRAQRSATKVAPWKIKWAIEKAVPDLVVDVSEYGRPNLGGACPWQLEGTYQGNPCYLRYRHDTAGMTVLSGEAWEGEELLVARIPGYQGEEYAGDLYDDEVVPFVQALVAALAPPSEENMSSQTVLRLTVDAAVKAMRAKDEAEAT